VDEFVALPGLLGDFFQHAVEVALELGTAVNHKNHRRLLMKSSKFKVESIEVRRCLM
jgi:hypothetical protein